MIDHYQENFGSLESVEEWYDATRIFRKYCVLNGKKHGTFVEFYLNGTPSILCNYKHGMIHGEHVINFMSGITWRRTWFYNNVDMKVDPSTLTEKDKAYILLSGRLPPKD